MNMLRRLAIHAPNSSEQGQAFQEFMEFNKFVRQLDEGLMRKYSVNVLESLEKEARTLRYLTVVFCKNRGCVLGLSWDCFSAASAARARRIY